MQIESTAVSSKRKGFKQTGQLGEVMVESAEIAYSYVMAHLASYDARPDFFDEHFVHLHVPAGATPKDGPSAGITMATALISMITGKPVKKGLGDDWGAYPDGKGPANWRGQGEGHCSAPHRMYQSDFSGG